LSYTVYHACSSEGGYDVLYAKAPFHSNRSRRQWLTQGYYFWRARSLAEQWGTQSYCSEGNYAILKATLNVNEDEMFDLVANTEHIELFEKLLSRFMNFMRKELEKRYIPTISAFMEYIREKAKISPEVFPFIAIMAAEEELNKKCYQFVDHRDNCIALNKRVQICLMEGNESRISNKELIYPESWVA